MLLSCEIKVYYYVDMQYYAILQLAHIIVRIYVDNHKFFLKTNLN